VWHYLVLFGYVVAAVFLSKLADVAMSRRFKTGTIMSEATKEKKQDGHSRSARSKIP